MGVKTAFSEDELRGILSEYTLGALQNVEPFTHGADQTNIKLLTTRGPIAFRYYEKRSTDYALFEMDLLQYLARRGYPCPIPIANARGHVVGTYRGKPYALFTFLEGAHDESVGRVTAVAREIARLHLLTARYRPVHSDLRGSYDRAYCLREAAEKAHTASGAVDAPRRFAWLAQQLDALALPEDLPQGVCHRDPNPSNVLYLEGRVSAVLDFDQAGYTWLVYDVAELVYWWAWPEGGTIQFDVARTALSGYQEVRPLSGAERRHLYDALLLINLVACAWYFDQDPATTYRRIALLTAIGRDAFHRSLFL